MRKVCNICYTIFMNLEKIGDCPIQSCYGCLHEVPSRYSDVASKLFRYGIFPIVHKVYPDSGVIDPPDIYFFGTNPKMFECFCNTMNSCNDQNLFWIDLTTKGGIIKKIIDNPSNSKNPSPSGFYDWGFRLNTPHQNLNIFGLIDREAELLKYLYTVVEQLDKNKKDFSYS